MAACWVWTLWRDGRGELEKECNFGPFGPRSAGNHESRTGGSSGLADAAPTPMQGN